MDPRQVLTMEDFLAPAPKREQLWRDPSVLASEYDQNQAKVDAAFPDWLKIMSMTLMALPAVGAVRSGGRGKSPAPNPYRQEWQQAYDNYRRAATKGLIRSIVSAVDPKYAETPPMTNLPPPKTSLEDRPVSWQQKAQLIFDEIDRGRRDMIAGKRIVGEDTLPMRRNWSPARLHLAADRLSNRALTEYDRSSGEATPEWNRLLDKASRVREIANRLYHLGEGAVPTERTLTESMLREYINQLLAKRVPNQGIGFRLSDLTPEQLAQVEAR